MYGPTSPPDQNPPHIQAHPGKMRIGRVTRLHGLRQREPGTLRVRLKGDDNDLPRKPENSDRSKDREALIGDPRNDENLIISQLHLAFLKAHNALVDQGKTFAQARRLLRQHYQHIVVHDFLRRVADQAIVDGIVQHGNRLYDPPAGQFYMPLEFTVAAYRFGHSMVRDSYDFNLNFNALNSDAADLSLLFMFTAFSGQIGSGVGGSVNPAGAGVAQFPTLPDNWIIECHRFADTADTKASNKARRIDTKLAAGLFGLQSLAGTVIQPPDMANLAVRNLLRGYQLRMPTGQAVARQLGLPPLTADQIKEAAANPQQVQALGDGRFLECTPLWYYLLAEAAHPSGGNGQRLGPVGSTIVAEVLIGLIRRSEDSILNAPGWQPSLPSAHPGRFELADLLRFAGVLPRTYKARANDVLSTIARDQLGDYRRWPEIFVLNWDTMDHHSRDRVRVGQVFLLPGNTPPGLRPVLHVTQRGDNLADLAKRYLGDRSRWPEIRDLNVDVLGNHPGPAANPQPPPNTQLVILPP